MFEGVNEIQLQDKVLDQIQNVRDWLDRAESDYQNDQTWQGELNLNLAQAELKKAWEESQKLHSDQKIISLPSAKSVVESDTEKFKSRTRVEKRRRFSALGQHRFGLVAAVVLLIFVSLTPMLSNGLLKQDQQGSGEIPGLAGKTMPEMIAMNQFQSNSNDLIVDEVSIQTLADQELRRDLPTNHQAYNKVPLGFNVQKDQLISTPQKGVKVEPVQFAESKIELTSQVALEPTNIQMSGMSKTFNPVGQKVYSTVASTSEVGSSHYDLDTLVDLAEEVLYTTKR